MSLPRAVTLGKVGHFAEYLTRLNYNRQVPTTPAPSVAVVKVTTKLLAHATLRVPLSVKVGLPSAALGKDSLPVLFLPLFHRSLQQK